MAHRHPRTARDPAASSKGEPGLPFGCLGEAVVRIHQHQAGWRLHAVLRTLKASHIVTKWPPRILIRRMASVTITSPKGLLGTSFITPSCFFTCRRMSFPSPLRWAALVLCLALTTTACTSTRATQTAAPDQNAQSSTEDTADLEALYWARQDSARSNYTEADVRFMTMMITHHAQALVMSRDGAAERGPSSKCRRSPHASSTHRRDEIATMQRWLRRRDQPVPTIEIDATDLRVDGMTVHGMDMVGVLTQAQIDELDAAQWQRRSTSSVPPIHDRPPSAVPSRWSTRLFQHGWRGTG